MSAFRDGQYSLVSFLFAVLLTHGAPRAQTFVKVGGGHVPPCPMESAPLAVIITLPAQRTPAVYLLMRQVPEDYPVDEPVFVVRADDEDRGDNAELSYFLETDTQLRHGQIFRLHRTSGEVIIHKLIVRKFLRAACKRVVFLCRSVGNFVTRGHNLYVPNSKGRCGVFCRLLCVIHI